MQVAVAVAKPALGLYHLGKRACELDLAKMPPPRHSKTFQDPPSMLLLPQREGCYRWTSSGLLTWENV